MPDVSSDSDFSMASVDTNPTFDQFDDGGSSADFASIVGTASSIGMEIAGAMTGAQSPTYAQALPQAPRPVQPKVSNNAQIILVLVIAAGAVWYFMSSSSA